MNNVSNNDMNDYISNIINNTLDYIASYDKEIAEDIIDCYEDDFECYDDELEYPCCLYESCEDCEERFFCETYNTELNLD